MTPDERKRGHAHGEAFHLMRYRSDDGLEEETLWNSRDGVTPFVISNKDRTKSMTHVDWGKDVYAPDHVPKPGDRVFADMTPEHSAVLAAEHVERYWEDPRFPMKDVFESKEMAVAKFAKEFVGEGDQPVILVVTENDDMTVAR